MQARDRFAAWCRIVLSATPLLLSACGDDATPQGTVKVAASPEAAPEAVAPTPTASAEVRPEPRFTPRPDIVAAIQRGARDLPPLPPPEALPKPENRIPTQADIERLRAEYANKKQQGGE